MKRKEQKTKEEVIQHNADLEDVKRKLKKKELQTSILKKIIEESKPSKNNPY